MSWLPLLAFGLGCSPEGLAEPTAVDTQPIVGGRDVAAGEFLAVVMLDTGCSGVVVHQRHLATAAHCTEQGAPRYATAYHELDVSVGGGTAVSVSAPQTADLLPIDACTSHRQREEFGFDIAVCRLTRDFEGVVPALAEAPPAVDESVTLVGYGFDSVGGEVGRKRAVTSRVREITEPSAGGELVIGSADAGTCRGDSGGPAFVESRVDATEPPTLVGILSAGEQGRCGFGWYVSVAAVRPWLLDELGVEATPPEPHRGCAVGAALGTTSGWGALLTGAALLAFCRRAALRRGLRRAAC